MSLQLKTYVCTTSAAQQKLCDEKDLGNFILDETAGPAATAHKERLDFGTDSQAKNLVSTSTAPAQTPHSQLTLLLPDLSDHPGRLLLFRCE